MQYIGHDQHGVAYYKVDGDVYSVHGENMHRECTYAGWGCRQVVHNLKVEVIVREFVVIKLEDFGDEIAPTDEIAVCDSAATARKVAELIHKTDGISCTVFERQHDGSPLHIGA